MDVRPIVATAVAFLIAGCSGGEGGKRDGFDLADGSRVDLDVEPTATGKGAIAGVVVDDAIRPIRDALVQAPGPGLSASSDETGVFVFNDLEPGTYILSISAPGYLAIQTSADVVADESTPVRVQLPMDNSPKPYLQTLHHDGFIQAWAGIAQFFIEAQLDEGSALCKCRLWFTPTETPVDVVYEAFWEYSMPDPLGFGEMYYVIEEPTGEGYESGYCYSPCRHQFGYEDGSFKAGTEAYARLDGPDFWPAVNQEFDLFVTLWFNAEAPDDWTIATPP